MNAYSLPELHAPSFAAAFGTDATLRIGDHRAPLAAWLAAGRAQWRASPAGAIATLRGVTDADALGKLLSALADEQPLLLCPADIAPPSPLGLPAMRRTDAASPLASHGAVAVLSSGTLGPPKILWHRTESLLATARLTGERLGIARGERVLIAVPVHHLYGLGAALLACMLAGADVLLLPKADLLSLNTALRTFVPQTTFATPHLLRAALQRKEGRIPGSQRVISAGDAMSDALLAQARACFGNVHNLYGSSELGVIAIADGDTPERLRPLPGVQVSLADAHEGRGRLQVAHPHPACLIERSGEAIQVSPHSPWDTGDIASIDTEGRLLVHGRSDLSINRAGRLLVLSEVEGIAMEWPGVSAAVAIPWSRDAAIGRGFSIVIEPEDVAVPPDITALKHEAIRTLPPFARPDDFQIITRLPRLANGKPDRRTLQKECGHG